MAFADNLRSIGSGKTMNFSLLVPKRVSSKIIIFVRTRITLTLYFLIQFENHVGQNDSHIDKSLALGLTSLRFDEYRMTQIDRARSFDRRHF